MLKYKFKKLFQSKLFVIQLVLPLFLNKNESY